jgi:hypothetical protein
VSQESKEAAIEIAKDFIKKQKKTEKVDVAVVETIEDCFVVRGMCPMYLKGHFWAEKFEVVIDQRGKIKSTFSSLP